ncbi:MAG: transcription-repair coupling factor [Alphaproteobacteria bacterium]|nr:transcription-repair coupling factor [Alphaproteobacteria bacterium]
MSTEQNKIQIYSSIPNGFDAFWLNDFVKNNNKTTLYIVSNGIELFQTAELVKYINPNVEVLMFPAWDTVAYDRASPNVNILSQRLETLSKLVLDPNPKQKRIVITSVGAAIQKLPPKKIFLNSNKTIKIGSKFDFNGFLHYCAINGYTKVEQVMEPAEFALRGDIIDIFPSGASQPIRIDLFDDEVENIRTFNPLNQRTTGTLSAYTFLVANEVVLNENTIKNFRLSYRESFGTNGLKDEIYEWISEGKKYIGMENWLPFFYDEPLPSLFDYVLNADIVLGNNYDDALKAKKESIIDYYTARLEALNMEQKSDELVYRPIKPELLYLTQDEFEKIINDKNAVKLTALSLPDSENVTNLSVIPARNFAHAKNINQAAVYQDLKDYLSENAKLKRIICCYSEGSRERMFHTLSEYGFNDLSFAENFNEALKKAQNKKIVLIVLNLEHGFKNQEFCIVSQADILGVKKDRKPSKKVSKQDFIADISTLNIGELVVHIEHGIGRFMGLETITAGGAVHDCLKIIYANNDKLFVPVENIDVVSRYGSDDENIVLDTLGSAAWQAKKAKVKEKIKDIAEKLIKLAAERKLKTSDAFVAPSGLYDEFCSRFAFNETEDQLRAIKDVLQDLNTGVPMDRLVCGDVGFGKTEVALRAAFTVASSGAQVALIVPTTLLARQHYLNFIERMKGFPIKVKMLSRLVSAKELKETQEGLKNGSIEIVIGTHALLSQNVKFCNLGLLIIDEEQHFGVAHKEKLKALKSDVHVLTLSATPIPRTLQLSLTGVKNLSIIATPPVDRLAARTFVMPFDKVMIKEAIYREKFRNGQVFFVCPRVSDIASVYSELKELVPDIKIAIAHGQMPVKDLEDVMVDFAAHKADLLLSTTIIESGIDMPSVNTMIIYRADMFGLAQLYQLRGRIGRSKIRGYCYFTIPPKKKLKPIAQKRLNILSALDTLGAGFSLASHDMDIRGSGNVLGTEQSGHIKDVGIALYHHMLEEEILRQKALAQQETVAEFNANDWAPQITTGIPIIIDEKYVKDLGVRLGLYKRIGAIKTVDEILQMREELIDRFGPIPLEVENLLTTIEIKQLCYKANIAKIDAGAKGILIAFHNDTFHAVDKLIELVNRSFGVVKIRPDQKLFIEGKLDDYQKRISVIKKYVDTLSKM